jgi:hypothetical protein
VRAYIVKRLAGRHCDKGLTALTVAGEEEENIGIYPELDGLC